MRNPFKNTARRRMWEAAVRCYDERHRNLFLSDGSRHIGSSQASYFWRGYDGALEGRNVWDGVSKEMNAYAFYRAGRDVRAREADPDQPAFS